MPTVSRLSGTATTPEGFAVETESGGDTYRYEFRIVSYPEEEGEDRGPGKVELDARYCNGEEVEPEATQAAIRPINEHGYEVA
ncbi:hypothetical protein BGV91_gp02 [Haloarcula californiae icosahedral virus 1]|uniref:Uncharacterized protein n=1 Tax=Haloarcula californiae icosahedral virus 1 TaxID=1735722 RepID=A0A1C7A3P5_9VIRU|nr:hypothetical protein BGV91_gp02 [Haloarcula californiae icosahedral virus 1]ALJ99665.1 hypothetical protein SS136_02 [Haloarcula californiae icosahedral virus 1]